MRLMFYINTLHRGGAERALSTICNGLVKRGHQCVFVTSYSEGRREYSLDGQVVRVNLEEPKVRGSYLSRNLRRTRALRKECKRWKPDVLVSFMQEPIIRALAATIGLPVKNIVSVRNDPRLYWQGFPHSVLAQILLLRADWVVFQTKDAQSCFPGRIAKRSSVILNPIAEEFFSVERFSTEKTIITCGRLEPQKNQALLIDAFAQSHAMREGWVLRIYGGGSLESQLREQISKRNLDCHVELMGPTDDVRSALASAGVFVLSSDYEGLPNALMEAMAAGVPCISTDCPCGGPRSLIEDGVNGLLVPVGDCQALATAIDVLISDYRTQDFLGKAARESLCTASTERVIRDWKSLLSNVRHAE